ncbi:hypothetical protein [Qipengyuania aquimaris]|uniref:hypothetical protein n=1 Tax=Qipengyuania aquimaris TaxID=255984 RepID=UPI001FD5EAD2|nr:hypothetical protein [Qipengyuania aquimaris]UOR14578.1 hypothetical protein LCM05_08740 [Qipengyuania aquimaris]
MGQEGAPVHAFVVKAEELPALYYMDEAHPRPIELEWINRGTDQPLRRTTVEMLLRTLFGEVRTPSVKKLHRSAGLRVGFRSERDRARFAKAFGEAVEDMHRSREHVVTAVFEKQETARKAVGRLTIEGVPEDAISMVWRASEYLAEKYEPIEGHSPPGIAGAIAGAGLAGAVLGVAILVIPGIGPVAVAGAMASQAIPSVAAVSSAIGATGGAVAKMLTDADVDGVSATLYEREIQRGRIFLSVNTDGVDIETDRIQRILSNEGGKGSSTA